MAKTPASTLITLLAKRMDLDSTDATVRADMLQQLNISQQDICGDHSLSFLLTNSTVTLTSGGSSVAVPSGLDISKAFTLGRVAGDGEIEFVPADEWYRKRIDTYGSPTETEPSFFTVANVAGTTTFLFKPGNSSGGNLAIPYLAQSLPTDMTDSGASYSVLPEGWENTLLLIDAEAELRRVQNEPQWAEMKARANERKERLYASYRTTKEQAMTDREQSERKIAKTKLQDEN
jgi:hypothetical protein